MMIIIGARLESVVDMRGSRIACWIFCFIFVVLPQSVFASDLDEEVIYSESGEYIPALVTVVDSPTLTSVDISKKRVSASDTSGFKAVMLTLLGDYETVVTDYTYQNQSGYITHSIQVERDWAWIMSCAMFIMVIYCTFISCAKILGGRW